jgi:hypothetical protein
VKASKLIEYLQRAIAQHGDQDVYIHDADTDWLLNIRYFRLAVPTEANESGFILAGEYTDDEPPGWYGHIEWQRLDDEEAS